MSLQTFSVRVKSAAAFERHFSRRTRAHFEKRLRQGRATIVGRLRQFCETPFDGSSHTWPRNDAGQLVCVFFGLIARLEAARARKLRVICGRVRSEYGVPRRSSGNVDR